MWRGRIESHALDTAMVINWDDQQTEPPETPPAKRAAEYVRMSTEHQQYSTDNQVTAIRLYAQQRGYEIVRTYADEGKSGLNIGGRPALQQLLRDAESGQTDFSAVLVYDVSRFGRFQDADEAASYELRLKRCGITIQYCADQFENDGSIGSSIIKNVKRVMAGAYSYDLSLKVFAGQANLIRRGYRQGGAAGFGLRRVLVDQAGTVKGELRQGEHKSIATDRVILAPGPPQEITVVREIYDLFVRRGQKEADIADALNGRGVATDLGRSWTRGSIHQILINEKYIGNNVWAKTSFKLKQDHRQNEPADWIRANGAFTPIVEPELFTQAQAIIAARSDRLSDTELLQRLLSILSVKGELTGLIIDEFDGCPSSSAYRCRFGSLLQAYALVGFAPNRDYRYLEINRSLRALHPSVVSQAVDGLMAAGGSIAKDLATDLLTINGEFTASIVIVRCFQTSAGSLRWKLRLDTALNPDLTVAIRMEENNIGVRDYYLLPRLDMHEAILLLCEHNGLSFDAYRFESLDRFYSMAARCTFRRAA